MLAELAPTDHSDALWMGMIEVALAQVRYSRRDQERALRRAFDRYVALLSVGSPEFEIKKCADAIANNASASASRFKHPAFASEKEWRIVISTSAFSNPELFFRSSSRTVIPYTKTGDQRRQQTAGGIDNNRPDLGTRIVQTKRAGSAGRNRLPRHRREGCGHQGLENPFDAH